MIERYGGTVEKFIGDAVMAVWGAPIAHEDDAERAVRAALELVESVKSLGPGIQARAGVLTGEAAVTIGATNQGMVAGDLVNTASAAPDRSAPPGTVLVGESTHRAPRARRSRSSRPASRSLKGKQAPVPAWRAVRVVAERGGRNRSESARGAVRRPRTTSCACSRTCSTPPVARSGCGWCRSSARRASARAGWRGSSRKYIDGLVEDVYWHTRSIAGVRRGHHLLGAGRDGPRPCGLLERDDEATTRAKVTETVAQWVPGSRRARLDRALRC